MEVAGSRWTVGRLVDMDRSRVGLLRGVRVALRMLRCSALLGMGGTALGRGSGRDRVRARLRLRVHVGDHARAHVLADAHARVHVRP